MKTKSNLRYQKSKTLMKKPKDPIKEARRYVDNAREILAERGKLDEDGIFYEDDKYVRAAGNYLWLGVLMALDGVFHVREDRRTRVNIEAYQAAVNKRDHKLLYWLNAGYETIHLFMNYDGIPTKILCDSGFNIANKIIDRCETMMPAS